MKNEELLKLVKSAQKGDKIALTNLCEQFQFLVRKYAHKSSVRTIDDMENILWEAIIEAVYRYDPAKHHYVAGILQKVVERKMIRTYQRRKNDWTHVGSGDLTDTNNETILNKIMGFSDTEETATLNLLSGELHTAMASLPEKQQIMLHYLYWENRSVREIASLMALSHATVSYHKKQALELLKKKIEK